MGLTESNKIEGILREPTAAEIEAHKKLLGYEALTVAAIEEFASVIAPNMPLRRRLGFLHHWYYDSLSHFFEVRNAQT